MNTTAQAQQISHALNALARTTPGRRRVIQACAEAYLSQVDRRRLPAAYRYPILDDRLNRADAFRMRRGDTLARMLGLAVRPDDPYLPDTARAVLAAIDAPVDRLTAAATASGQPHLIAVLWLATAGRTQTTRDTKRTAPEPEVIETVPARGSLLGYDRYAIAPGAPLPDGRTITHVEDPLGSAWRVTDDQGAVHYLHKHGLLRRYTSGAVAFIEPSWAA